MACGTDGSIERVHASLYRRCSRQSHIDPDPVRSSSEYVTAGAQKKPRVYRMLQRARGQGDRSRPGWGE